MTVSSVNNLAGCCTTLQRTASSAVHWIGDNMKTAGTACWEALKKAASYVSNLFASLGKSLYQGALLIKGSVVSAANQMKNYLCTHPRDLKVLGIGAAVGIVLATIVGFLCCRTSSEEVVEVEIAPASPSQAGSDLPFVPSAQAQG